MPRLDQFEADLVRSGLMARPDVAGARAQLDPAPAADDPEAAVRLARLLIEQGRLTRYQANKLLNGNTFGFFLGGCRVLRRLGEGGMGKVYLAEREGDGRRVAVKVLPPQKAQEESQALARFLREVELSRRLIHPNVARLLDYGREGDVYFMVLEYVPGASLYDLVKGQGGGPLRVPDAARYFLKVLDGLQAAHAAGLVHRDIKPSNLMVTPEGDAKILDLGLARGSGVGEEGPLTRPGAVVGTLDYASPEQLQDASRADARSDLYSLGCTIYFALAGRPPFEGGDLINKIYKQRMEDADPLERVARGVPPPFAAIVRKLMAKEPADRYQDVAELRTDLARWADPRRARALLGAEAEAARAFRPPPPELDDDELRQALATAGPGSTVELLRDLGDAEAADAPMHRPPPPPRPAVLLNGARPPSQAMPAATRPATAPDDLGWLLRYSIIAAIVGIIAVLVISLWKWA